MAASNFTDLTGMKFSMLTVLKRLENNKHGNSTWLCKCECGKETKCIGSEIKNSHKKSCGCRRINVLGENSVTHGQKRVGKVSAEYNVWATMVQRCTNQNNKSYPNYGGRGINICDRWRVFENFYADMGNRPSKSHSIDRVDVNGIYELTNCRWVTSESQNRNKRMQKNNTTGVKGVYWIRKLQKYIVRIHPLTLGYTDSIEEARKIRSEGEIKYWGKESS